MNHFARPGAGHYRRSQIHPTILSGSGHQNGCNGNVRDMGNLLGQSPYFCARFANRDVRNVARHNEKVLMVLIPDTALAPPQHARTEHFLHVPEDEIIQHRPHVKEVDERSIVQNQVHALGPDTFRGDPSIVVTQFAGLGY